MVIYRTKIYFKTDSVSKHFFAKVMHVWLYLLRGWISLNVSRVNAFLVLSSKGAQLYKSVNSLSHIPRYPTRTSIYDTKRA